MKYPRCIALVVLVFATFLNQGQKLKSNERRAAGLVPYPRIGRHLAMASFARGDGNAGLVNYPRVGRSGSLGPLTTFDLSGLREFDPESRVDVDRDFDIGTPEDFVYTGYHPVDSDESKKRYEAASSGSWPGVQSSSSEKYKERRMHRCNQQIDGPWAVLFATRDLPSLDQQPAHNFIPRLVREIERDAASTNNIV